MVEGLKENKKAFIKKLFTEKRYLFLLLGVILAVQLFFIVFMVCQKAEFHIDEIYSYILSNSYEVSRISEDLSVWDTWFNGEYFKEFLTVQSGEGFAYSRVYYNNSLDAHPPLYYFLLHTICSFTPGIFSMWQGISLNVFCFIVTQIFFYLLSLRLLKNPLAACIPLLIYGFSPIAIDTVIFIRMYALLTMLTTILAYLHIRLLQDGAGIWLIVLCGVVTFLGVFTQYFFAPLAACMALAYCIYSLVRKQYKYLAIYAIAMLLAVILVFIVYPAGITQILGSETNNVGKNVTANFLNIKLWLQNILSFGYQVLSGFAGGYLAIKFVALTVFLSMMGVIVYIILRKKKRGEALTLQKKTEAAKEFSYKNIKFVGVALLIVIGNIILVAKVCGEFCYLRYLYNTYPVMILSAFLLLYLGFSRLTIMRLACICLAGFSFVNVMGVAFQGVNSYLYEETAKTREEIIEEYGDIPLIFVTGRKTYVPTSGCNFIRRYSHIYMTSNGNVENIDEILSEVDISKGFLCYIWTDTVWGQGYVKEEKLEEIKESSAYTYEIKETGNAISFGQLYYFTVK